MSLHIVWSLKIASWVAGSRSWTLKISMPRLRALLLCQTLMTLQGPYETAGYYVMEGDNCGWIKKWCQNYLGVSLTFTFLTVRGSGFRNLGKICLWNLESRKILLVKSGILGFGIRNPTNDWNQESRFHWQKLESSTWNLESVAESKNVFDSLEWNDLHVWWLVMKEAWGTMILFSNLNIPFLIVANLKQ